MAIINLREQSLTTCGTLPTIGAKAPDFVATMTDLSTMSLSDYTGRPILINVYPSIDTAICFDSVKKFQEANQKHVNLAILCISMDLPFALKRVSEGEHLGTLTLLSDFRNRAFGELFGLTIMDGPLAGLLARAVIVLDAHHNVIYSELVQDIASPPNYQAAMRSLNA